MTAASQRGEAAAPIQPELLIVRLSESWTDMADSCPEPPIIFEDLSGGSRSSRVLAAILTWTVSAFKTRGIHISPGFKLDRSALKRVSRVVCVLPLVNGAAALLELLSRLILLILFLALSCTPRHRKVMVERMRVTLQMHVQSVRRLSMIGEIEDAAQPTASPEASVLVVGHGSVGKTSLTRALHRLAKKVPPPPLSPFPRVLVHPPRASHMICNTPSTPCPLHAAYTDIQAFCEHESGHGSQVTPLASHAA